MLSPRSVMALLVMVALSAKAAESDFAAPEKCSAEDLVLGGFCFNCQKKAKCDTLDAEPADMGDCTVPGEACTVLAGVATCKPFADTACKCDKPAQCDAYDPNNSVLICLSGGDIVIQPCTDPEGCVNGACTEPTTTPSPGGVCAEGFTGFVVMTPFCTTAAYCLDGKFQGNTDCASGKYFDMDESLCKPIPPVPCADCDRGACPDKSDCSKWYICEGGTVQSNETCYEPFPDFDSDSNACVASGTGICPGNDNCTYGLPTSATTVATTVVSSSDGSSTDDGGTTGGGSDSTTSAPGSTDDSTTTTSRPAECTADNVGQNYPFEGDCKKYWACLQVGGPGQYAYVERICLGDLVFNPAKGFCDTVANTDCE